MAKGPKDKRPQRDQVADHHVNRGHGEQAEKNTATDGRNYHTGDDYLEIFLEKDAVVPDPQRYTVAGTRVRDVKITTARMLNGGAAIPNGNGSIDQSRPLRWTVVFDNMKMKVGEFYTLEVCYEHPEKACVSVTGLHVPDEWREDRGRGGYGVNCQVPYVGDNDHCVQGFCAEGRFWDPDQGVPSVILTRDTTVVEASLVDEDIFFGSWYAEFPTMPAGGGPWTLIATGSSGAQATRYPLYFHNC